MWLVCKKTVNRIWSLLLAKILNFKTIKATRSHEWELLRKNIWASSHWLHIYKPWLKHCFRMVSSFSTFFRPSASSNRKPINSASFLNHKAWCQLFGQAAYHQAHWLAWVTFRAVLPAQYSHLPASVILAGLTQSYCASNRREQIF